MLPQRTARPPAHLRWAPAFSGHPLRRAPAQSKVRGRSAFSSFSILLTLVLVAALIILAVRWQSRPIVRTSAGAAEGASDSTASGLPSFARKPKPVSPGFEGCPAEGDGGDPELNRLKNRVDSTEWLPARFDAVLALRWPAGIGARRRRSEWTRRESAEVGRSEGLPVAVEGYFVAAKQQGPEATNCHGADARFRDWHLWLSASPERERRRSIVVETIPAVRALHPSWSLRVIRRLVHDSSRVRVSGWLMLDPEHPDQLRRTRGTLWEIHPVMRVDVWRDRQWVNIESDTVPNS